MNTVLLVSIAIAVPLLLVLTLLVPSAAGLESESRSWRIPARTGSVLLLFISAGLFLFGAVSFVRAMSFSDRWSAMAVSLFAMTEGARTAILFLPLASGTAVNQQATSHFVRAGGYCLITLFLLIASFAESWWCLAFAGLSTWFAGMSAHFGRQSS